MTKKHKTSDTEQSNAQTYQGVGIVFFVVGIALSVSGETWVAGLPFLVLGFTFFILSQEGSPKRPKK